MLISIAREVSATPNEPPEERYVLSCGYIYLTIGLKLITVS